MRHHLHQFAGQPSFTLLIFFIIAMSIHYDATAATLLHGRRFSSPVHRHFRCRATRCCRCSRLLTLMPIRFLLRCAMFAAPIAAAAFAMHMLNILHDLVIACRHSRRHAS
jgi:hypothetical protein